MQAAMAKKKRHSRVEITTKLAQANDLATQGNCKAKLRARLA
jgi:hypothetical protein